MKITKISLYIILTMTVLTVSLSACLEDKDFSEDPSHQLEFSLDTLFFDTVFTTIGSSTEYFMIYNRNNKPLKIANIELAGSSNSAFRINIDGESGSSFQDIIIEANDSLWGFVEVTVDPLNSNNPMVITDSIVFETNGNIQDIDLVAWGQDAHFIVANKSIGSLNYKIIAGENETIQWTNDKPYVIYGWGAVDSTGQLFIQEGCKIHFHHNSGLWIYRGGSLMVNGSQQNPVVFQGDRPEPSYDEREGQWDRIWIMESDQNSEINWAVIKNGFIGIQAEKSEYDMSNQLIIKNTKIRNMTGVGVLARNYKIKGENVLVSNCAQYTAAMTQGGDYEFTHCTFANYWSSGVRQTPSVFVNNYLVDNDFNVYGFDLDRCDFINCIIYGNLGTEFYADSLSTNSYDFNYHLTNTIIKADTIYPSQFHFTALLQNENPLFDGATLGDYHLQNLSPAIDAGNTASSVLFDLDGNMRDAQPDLGVYEKQ